MRNTIGNGIVYKNHVINHLSAILQNKNKSKSMCEKKKKKKHVQSQHNAFFFQMRMYFRKQLL